MKKYLLLILNIIFSIILIILAYKAIIDFDDQKIKALILIIIFLMLQTISWIRYTKRKYVFPIIYISIMIMYIIIVILFSPQRQIPSPNSFPSTNIQMQPLPH